MSEKLLLIDGHSILNRAFYGIPLLTNSEGLHTNAVYGFLNILFHVLDEETPDYLAVAFDLKAPTFRHKMYPEYKGTRKAMPEELREQVPLIKEMLCAMQIPLLMLEGYEADDLIGTISLQAEKKGMQVSILSGDRDLLQLASELVCVRIPKTKQGRTQVENYYADDVLEHYLVTPAQIIELKALMGDASDNIPGIPGVGEKTAQKIISQFGTIENAYAHAQEITPNRARTSLTEHYDMAQLSKALATIDRESPVTLNLEEARMGDLYTPQALTLCRRLEFRNLLSRFEGKEESALPKVQIVSSVFQWQEFLRRYPAAVSGDGSRVDSRRAYRIGIAFPDENAQEKDRFYGVSILPAGEDLPDPAEAITCCVKTGEEEDRFRVEEELFAVMEDAEEICAVDLKRQYRPLWEKIPGERFFDASVGAYLLNPLKGVYPFDEIAREYAGLTLPSAPELLGKKGRTASGEGVSEENKACCAGFEALSAAASRDRIRMRLEEDGMLALFDEMEMPLVFTLWHMQREGITVRGEELSAFGERLTGRIRELEEQIWQQAGEEFNIQSPKQLGVILFEKLGMPYGKKTKTGYSTSADVLEKLSGEYPVVSDILEYRQLTKLKSTYADGLAAFISSDGRIHGTFNQTITATGRISSTDPNLQNIPVRTELGRELRKVFVPADGYEFVDADYSQIELRVLAHMSGDEKLIEAYASAQDIHAITASQVFHVPLDEVTPLERRNAKAVNFGIVYGISSFGLSQDLSISRKEAQEYIRQYFVTYPGIKQFLDHCVESAKADGYSVTMFGRRRPIPELHSSNFMQRSFGERVAMNAPIQGTAADIIKIAMIRVDQRLRKECTSARLLLQIHDELLVETRPEETEKVRKILQEEMTGAAKLSVCLEIDMHTGASWFDAK